MAQVNGFYKPLNDKAMETSELLSSKMFMALIAIEQIYSAAKYLSVGFLHGITNAIAS